MALKRLPPTHPLVDDDAILRVEGAAATAKERAAEPVAIVRSKGRVPLEDMVEEEICEEAPGLTRGVERRLNVSSVISPGADVSLEMTDECAA